MARRKQGTDTHSATRIVSVGETTVSIGSGTAATFGSAKWIIVGGEMEGETDEKQKSDAPLLTSSMGVAGWVLNDRGAVMAAGGGLRQ
jgi:hypothetical protein